MIEGDVYCKKCYGKLEPADGFNRCQQCGRTFNPANNLSYLRRPFPSKMRIFSQIMWTTFLGFIVAFVVAMFQTAGASGH